MKLFSISIFAGSLWGIGEVLIWNLLKFFNVETKSPFVFSYGIFILTISRMLYNKKGVSLLTGLFAVSFKFLHLPGFLCQFVAVIIEAFSFEIGFLLIPHFKNVLIPLFATYLSYLSFAFTAYYILKVPFWVRIGIEGIKHYVFVNGSFAFILSLLSFNLAAILAKYLSKKEFFPLVYLYKKYGIIFSIILFFTSWLIINIF